MTRIIIVAVLALIAVLIVRRKRARKDQLPALPKGEEQDALRQADEYQAQGRHGEAVSVLERAFTSTNPSTVREAGWRLVENLAGMGWHERVAVMGPVIAAMWDAKTGKEQLKAASMRAITSASMRELGREEDAAKLIHEAIACAEWLDQSGDKEFAVEARSLLAKWREQASKPVGTAVA